MIDFSAFCIADDTANVFVAENRAIADNVYADDTRAVNIAEQADVFSCRVAERILDADTVKPVALCKLRRLELMLRVADRLEAFNAARARLQQRDVCIHNEIAPFIRPIRRLRAGVCHKSVRAVYGVPSHAAVDNLAQSQQLRLMLDDVRIALAAPVRLIDVAAEVAVRNNVIFHRIAREVARAACRDRCVCNVLIARRCQIRNRVVRAIHELDKPVRFHAVGFCCIFYI